MLNSGKKSFAPPRAFRRLAFALTAAFALSISLNACSRNNKDDEPAEPVEPTYLRVENRAFLDMTLYVIRSSQRIRLGTVTGNTTSRLLIPANVVTNSAGSLQFQASPIGGSRAPISQQIAVTPGDEILLIIPPS